VQPNHDGKQTAELQLVVFLADQVTRYALAPGARVTIGRAEDNDVRIDSASVSRKHCVLHVGPPLRIEDLGGPNGTFVREPRQGGATHDTQDMRMLSGQTVPVQVGDTINVGTATLLVRRGPSPATGHGSEPIVRDAAMRALYEQAERAAKAPISVLILGETGVGKDVLARHIHAASPRASGPFIGLNCAALSESLLESELFGHEKGAFTGALQARPGLFEAAHGGTVFLDEVGELPSSMQVKLLRVLEDRKVMRVGGRSALPVDVRFVAATNKDLEAAGASGAFRQDLFFRLNGISFTLPPLRERTSEIEPLAELFIRVACRQMDRAEIPTLSAEARARLEAHAWPGNVRELRNVMERAVVLSGGDTIGEDDLPQALRGGRPAEPRPSGPPSAAAPRVDEDGAPADDRASDPLGKLRDEIEQLERQRILAALEKCAGNQTQAAALLGISRRTLVTRLSEYDLPRPRKRS
jgi:DNA-binding NtrC family response regulator